MGEIITFEPKPAELAYTFGGVGPVAQLRPGDVLTVFTEDCFGGAVRSVDDLPSQVCRMPYLNPVSGPFLVEDAEPGDTLAVHFLDISPARDWGMSSTFPHFGALTSTHTTAMLQPPLQERVWRFDIDRAADVVRYRARTSDYTVDLPLEPMHGTVGVAPAGFQALSSITCDVHGGNLDSPEVRAGTTLYLPVFVHGALLALGDGHARQGQGEASGVAVETTMWTALTVDLIKGVVTPTPRLETDEALLSIGCARPLEDAYRISQHDLVRWVAEMTSLDLLDALQLVAQAGAAPVGQRVRPELHDARPDIQGVPAWHRRVRRRPRAATRHTPSHRPQDRQTMTVHVTAGEAHRMHTSAEPDPGLRLALSAELYFAAHDDITGELHISEESLAIGLAGAIVLDLRFAGYLEIGWSWHQQKQRWEPFPGRFTPLKPGPVGDPLMDAALTAINYLKRQRQAAAVRTEAASPRGGRPAQQHPPAQHSRTDELRTFVRQFAADNLYERVRASMIASGLLRRTQRRRLAGLVKTDAYLAAHYGYPVRPRAFAVDAVDFYQRPSGRRRTGPDEQCVAFCGLVGVLGLAEFLYHPSLSNSDLTWWLNHVVEQSRHPTIPIVVSAVDAGRGDLAVAAMR